MRTKWTIRSDFFFLFFFVNVIGGSARTRERRIVINKRRCLWYVFKSSNKREMRSELLFMCFDVVNNFVSFILMLMQIVNKSISRGLKMKEQKNSPKNLMRTICSWTINEFPEMWRSNRMGRRNEKRHKNYTQKKNQRNLERCARWNV